MKRAQDHEFYALVVRENPDGTIAFAPTFRHDVAEEWQRLGHRVELLIHTACEHGPGNLNRTVVTRDTSKDGTPEQGAVLVKLGTHDELLRIDAAHTLEQYIEQALRMKFPRPRSEVAVENRTGEYGPGGRYENWAKSFDRKE